jgi:hypothetical protein
MKRWRISLLVTLCVVWATLLLAACGGGADVPTDEAQTPLAAADDNAGNTTDDTSTDTGSTDNGEPAATATPAASPTADEPALSLADEIEVTNAGYAIQPIEGWTLEQSGKIISMTAPDADPASGPTIVITVGSLEELNISEVNIDEISSLDAFYEAMTASLEQETAQVTLGEPNDTTVADLPARIVPFTSTGFGGVEGETAGQLAVALIDEEHALVMLGVASPPELWIEEESFNALFQTVRLLDAD